MHRALRIDEILLNIFRNCSPEESNITGQHSYHAKIHLPVLARTCRAFKEPALNIIWAELDCLSPLLWPWATREMLLPYKIPVYSLTKPLEEADWNIILSNARRVRTLRYLFGPCDLTGSSVRALSNPPASSGPIFPNLRTLTLEEPFATATPLIQHLVRPTITDLSFDCMKALASIVGDLGERCPLVTNLYLTNSQDNWDHDTTMHVMRHWKNLHSVHCFEIDLRIDVLSHFSRMPNFRSLTFMVGHVLVDQIRAAPPSASILAFPALRELDLNGPVLTPIGWLLSHFRLPVIRSLSVNLLSRPTPPALISLFESLHKASAHTSLNSLEVCISANDVEAEIPPAETCPPYHITSDHLQPLTPFGNIKSILIWISCGVDLSEDQLLTLASSWPHLEDFELGMGNDWVPQSAITPDGFVRFLEQCRSLRVLHYRLDTRGYTEVPQGDPWRGRRMPKHASINLVNSPIEEESVEALAVFFHVAPYPDFELSAHRKDQYGGDIDMPPQPQVFCEVAQDRWTRVNDLARDLWTRRNALRHALSAPSWWHCPR